MKRVAQGTVLTLIVLIFSACQGQSAKYVTPTPPANGVLTPGIVPSTKALLPRALEAARKWQADAYVYHFDVTLIDSRVQDNSGAISTKFLTGVGYNFKSRTDREHDYSVLVQWNGEVIGSQAPAEPGDWPPIEAADWSLDSRDAWQIALAKNGSQQLDQVYRNKLYGTISCYMRLMRFASIQQRLVWDVSCETGAVDQKLFRLWIDPRSGEIVQTF